MKKDLKLKNNVKVAIKSSELLQETEDRKHLREQYRKASVQVRNISKDELGELDILSGEGLK